MSPPAEVPPSSDPLNDSLPVAAVNFSAAAYRLAGQTAYWHYDAVVGRDPVVTFAGPTLGEYVAGLLIVPIICAVAVALWMVGMAVFACCTCCRDREGSCRECRGCREGRCNRGAAKCRDWFSSCSSPLDRVDMSDHTLQVVYILILLTSLVFWVVALAFQLNNFTADASLAEGAIKVSRIFQNVSRLVLAANQTLSNVIRLSPTLPSMCIPLLTNGSYNATAELLLVSSQLTNRASSALATNSDIVQYANDIVNSLDHSISSLDDFANVRVGLSAGLMGVEVFLLVCILTYRAFVLRHGTRPVACRWRAFGGKTGMCTPSCTLLLVNAFVMFLCASVAFSLTLFVSDVCTPNPNVNVDRLLGQVLNFEPAANASPQLNTTEMCNIIVDSGIAPKVMNVMCYYQTCSTSNDFYVRVEHTMELASASARDMARLVLNVTERNISTLPQCQQLTASLYLNSAYTVYFYAWAVYQLSCHNVNPIYSDALYVKTCVDLVSKNQVVVALWFVASVILLLCIMFRVVYRDQFEEITRRGEVGQQQQQHAPDDPATTKKRKEQSTPSSSSKPRMQANGAASDDANSSNLQDDVYLLNNEQTAESKFVYM